MLSFRVARREHILELRSQGRTLKDIGQTYGLTRERIRQIINTPLVEQTVGEPKAVMARGKTIRRQQGARRKTTYLDVELVAKFTEFYQPGMSANRLALLAKTQWVYARRWLTSRTLATPYTKVRQERR